ncbi:MAG: hypothetical protein NT172_10560 [Planctomycetota bacterium]|nr:hypothetical protein [Planctomycetota bacterium]
MRLAPRPECKNCWSCRRPVVSSLGLLKHRLLAEVPSASTRSKSAIHGREEYRIFASGV